MVVISVVASGSEQKRTASAGAAFPWGRASMSAGSTESRPAARVTCLECRSSSRVTATVGSDAPRSPVGNAFVVSWLCSGCTDRASHGSVGSSVSSATASTTSPAAVDALRWFGVDSPSSFTASFGAVQAQVRANPSTRWVRCCSPLTSANDCSRPKHCLVRVIRQRCRWSSRPSTNDQSMELWEPPMPIWRFARLSLLGATAA